MAFDLPDRYNTVYRLKFDAPELADLQVAIRPSYGLVESAAEAQAMDLEALRAGMARPQDLQTLRRLVDDFAAALVSWNLHVDGQPVPATAEAVRGLDITFVLALVAAWFDAVTDMAEQAKQGVDQAGGEPSLPMDVLAG